MKNFTENWQDEHAEEIDHMTQKMAYDKIKKEVIPLLEEVKMKVGCCLHGCSEYAKGYVQDVINKLSKKSK